MFGRTRAQPQQDILIQTVLATDYARIGHGKMNSWGAYAKYIHFSAVAPVPSQPKFPLHTGRS